MKGFREEGKVVTAYGAPAKGNTLLNFCEFTADDIVYITDTTPHKIGLLTPGSHIPVKSPEVLREKAPDYILLLAWNYRDFILEKEKELRAQGTKFIIPIHDWMWKDEIRQGMYVRLTEFFATHAISFKGLETGEMAEI